MESRNVSTAPKSSSLQFDLFAIISISGILKIIQLVASLGGLICIESSGEYSRLSRSEYYLFVSAAALCVTGILLILYLINFPGKFSSIPWVKFEFMYCVIWAVFFLIAGSLTIGLINGSLNVAGWFAFVAVFAFAIDACYKFWMIHSGRPAQ